MVQNRFSCYQLVDDLMTYDAAQLVCKQNGGDLASIATDDDFLFVADQLVNTGARNDYWIGYSDDNWNGMPL
jgi:hypothetical protein